MHGRIRPASSSARHAGGHRDYLFLRPLETSAVPTIKVTTEISLDIETAAKWFTELDDDQMCKFLVEVARIANQWGRNPDNQWYYLGGHLRNCKCSTPEAREMVKAWAHYAETSEHN